MTLVGRNKNELSKTQRLTKYKPISAAAAIWTNSGV